MSPETAKFLLDLVNAQTLNVGAPDFAAVVALVQDAQTALTALANSPAVDA